MKIPTTCRECGNQNLTWNAGVRDNGPSINGRLRLNEIQPIFYLGCENCSETLLVVHANKIAEVLNTMMKMNDRDTNTTS